MLDWASSPLPFDKELWFYPKEGCCDSTCHNKHYVIGNVHTFRGRFIAYCSTFNQNYMCSVNEMNQS